MIRVEPDGATVRSPTARPVTRGRSALRCQTDDSHRRGATVACRSAPDLGVSTGTAMPLADPSARLDRRSKESCRRLRWPDSTHSGERLIRRTPDPECLVSCQECLVSCHSGSSFRRGQNRRNGKNRGACHEGSMHSFDADEVAVEVRVGSAGGKLLGAVPRSTIRPWSSTSTWSAWRIVLSRCATTKLVRPAQQNRQRGLQSRLGLPVDAAGRLVENQNPRVGQHGPREADQLPLPDRQTGAAFSDTCLKPVGQVGQQIEAVEPAHARRSTARRWRPVGRHGCCPPRCRRTENSAASTMPIWRCSESSADVAEIVPVDQHRP